MGRAAATLALVAGMALTIAGAASAANTRSYPDASGDASGGVDISNVTVSVDNANVLTIDTTAVASWPGNAHLEIWFDVPPISANPEHGDYLLWLNEAGTPGQECTSWKDESDNAQQNWVTHPANGFACSYQSGNRFRFVLNASTFGTIPPYFYTRAITYDSALVRKDLAGWNFFNIDVTSPDTTITSGPSAPTTSRSATFTYSASEAGSTFECSLDNGAFAGCAVVGAGYNNLPDGVHTFRVRARDQAGNLDASAATRTWVVDGTAPDTAIQSGPASSTTSRSASFTFTTSEPGSVFECSLDSGAFTGCSSPAGYGSLAAGFHNFRVRSRDGVGNVDATPATYNWTVQGGRVFEARKQFIRPAAPRAGKTVVVGATFVYMDNDAPVRGGTARCRGRLGSKALRAKLAVSGGVRTCTFGLSANAAGKRFSGRVTLAKDGIEAWSELQRTVVGVKRLTVLGPNTLPKRPAAGQKFAAAWSVRLVQPGVPFVGVTSGKVICTALLGGRPLRATLQRFLANGGAYCTFEIPASARGATLSGRVVIRAKGLTASKSFRFTVG